MTQINKFNFRSAGRAQPDTLTDPAGGACHGLDGLLQPQFFKALGDPNRVTILARLAHSCRPMSVSEIGTDSPVSLSVVSRHLAMLRDAGILVAEKRGRVVTYSVRYSALVHTLRQLADAIEACCSPPTNETRLTDNER